MKKILLIGSQGQVGQELQRILIPLGNIVTISRPTVDLLKPDSLPDIIQHHQPQVIINAAAYTAVEKAETEPDLALTINSTSPGRIAKVAEKIGAYFIHFSTDYVFDGKKASPYKETDPTNPLNVYGKTKLAGEQLIQQNCQQHLILRTAWIYSSLSKSNFVKTMLQLGQEKAEIFVVADQIGSPTWARDIADVIAKIIYQIAPNITGTYHYTNSGVASWYDFAIAIFEEAQQLGFPLTIKQVVPINTSQYPTLATRPLYSVLSCNKISTVLESHIPHWRIRLRQMLAELYLYT
ncbi:dTDP-4-dehydrorhamnose reductase [Nostoc sp. FACHB-110]|uniref:dTDP-4-dehydrorhamnose reductase n=1 Tax=Nostoc sp. FACHB-110 TaxID=2692834 RepID=UPI001683B2E8|nr:dTDP-4-dehydrorhamnose reductase [Nostoc sp. FACHB-110]MBD2438300.1 dTDP-4-dehydrorhamnose reductase [Nostoc sp. FACHB-110]